MRRRTLSILIALSISAMAHQLFAYPPAVGILGDSKNCLSCHVDDGPWADDGTVIIDILDKDTKTSLRQEDGSFLIEAKRGQSKTVLTVIGTDRSARVVPPTKNAWLYVDPDAIGGSSLSSFAPGGNVNLPMACRVTGDRWQESVEGGFTVLPMSVRPTDAARNAMITLQVMLTKGETIKGKAREGLVASYFERKVALQVID